MKHGYHHSVSEHNTAGVPLDSKVALGGISRTRYLKVTWDCSWPLQRRARILWTLHAVKIHEDDQLRSGLAYKERTNALDVCGVKVRRAGELPVEIPELNWAWWAKRMSDFNKTEDKLH